MPATLQLTPVDADSTPVCVVAPDKPASIGRLVENDLCIPVESVSRRHATILAHDEQWFAVDLASKAFTRLNNVTLKPHQPTPLSDGDIIHFGPAGFRITIGHRDAVAANLLDDDDDTQTSLTRETPPVDEYANQRLTLLSEVIERFVAVPDEQSLYDVALQTAIDGSGFARAAFLRPIGRDGAVEIVATARRGPDDGKPFSISRSLVVKAADGDIITLRTRSDQDQIVTGQSIVQLRIHTALCAPLFFADSIEGFLYLDARGNERDVAPDAASFCRLLSRAFALALSSVRRLELERRQQRLQAELHTARHVQQVMMPPTHGTMAFLEYAAHTQPGVIVAGDLFDIYPLHDDRIAVCFGDVAGHGIDSALIMALAQSFLHARLKHSGDVASAVTELNRYLVERLEDGRFVTLWVGAFSADGRVEYVDAGHGYAAFDSAEGFELSGPASNIPVGILDDRIYTSTMRQFGAGARIVLYSDGMIEQTNATGEPFGGDRLQALLRVSTDPRADVASIFESVRAFSAGASWNDDATVVAVRYAAP